MHYPSIHKAAVPYRSSVQPTTAWSPSDFQSESRGISKTSKHTRLSKLALNFQPHPSASNKSFSRMPAPPSASANSTPSKGSYSSCSHSLLPSQTMPFLSSHLITDCHTVSHNCRPCLSSDPKFPGAEDLPVCSSRLTPREPAQAERAGPWKGRVSHHTSQLLAHPSLTTWEHFAHLQTRPATVGEKRSGGDKPWL